MATNVIPEPRANVASSGNFQVVLYAEFRGKGNLHLIFNTYWHPLDFDLPLLSDGKGTWRRWIDASLDSQHDMVDWHHALPVADERYRAGARSLMVDCWPRTPGLRVETQRRSCNGT
jgi:pullulanase/glycogen debranching enzyme